MANKYLIHGATYCGDGTSSAEAASAGAVGAWNDINVMEGTAPAQGTLAAGDVVYVRSKTSGGANITRTLAANVSIGSSNATAAAPIQWILDDGTVWSSIAGTLTYEHNGNWAATLLTNNFVTCLTQDRLVFKATSASIALSGGMVVIPVGALLENVFIDISAKTSGGGAPISLAGTLVNPRIKTGALATSSNPAVIIYPTATALLINPDIELSVFTGTASSVFRPTAASHLRVVGGRVWGTGATTGQALVYSGFLASLELVGLQYPKTMPVFIDTASTNAGMLVSGVGLDSGVGATASNKGGTVDSRDDNNYPTLNATLPNSVATPWSWKLYPEFANSSYPLVLPVAHLFSDTAAAKTITLELLVSDSFSAISKSTVFLTLCYIDDTTGLPKYMSSRDPGGASLATSTAAWGSTTYGAVTLLKRKIALTTPTSIKKDTMIVAELVCIKGSASATDILFACPGMVLS